MTEIKIEEYEDWLRHPFTRGMREQFERDIARLKDEWASGAYRGDPLRGEYVRGQCHILQQFLDLDHSDLAKD